MTITKILLATIAIASASTSSWASPYISTGQYFIEPGSWNVGDAGSTHQAWDTFYLNIGNLPDAGHITSPAIATDPTVDVTSSGFVTGTNNFYSFSSNYSLEANVYNHGTGGADGTHVIVQTAGTQGGYNGNAVLPDSLQIVDLAGGALTGGDNASALVDGAYLAAGTVGSSFGSVTMEIAIWEFFLPGYTGDFQVKFDEEQHSSFDQLRVDTIITTSALPATSFAFQLIPEPATLALVGLSLVGLSLSRRRS